MIEKVTQHANKIKLISVVHGLSCYIYLSKQQGNKAKGPLPHPIFMGIMAFVSGGVGQAIVFWSTILQFG